MPCRAISSTSACAIRAGTGVRRFSSGSGVTRVHRTPRQTGRRSSSPLSPSPAAENRAQPHFESVERARHAQPGIRVDRAAPGTRPCRRRFAITSGRASRSNSARTRPSSAGSTGVRVCVNSTRSACCFGDCVTRIQPFARRAARCGRTQSSVTCSTPRERARGEKREHARSSRTAGDTRAAASTSGSRHRRGTLGRLLAQARRRHPVAAGERVVEPAQARESAGERHLGHRQRRLGQQLLGEQQPPRQQQLDRRHAQLVLDDAADLAASSARTGRRSPRRPPSRRVCPSSRRCTISRAMRCASSTGALPGASSGRQRRHGRKPACSASCGVSKKRQLAAFGVFTRQIGRQ